MTAGKTYGGQYRPGLKDYAFLHLSFLVYSASSVFAKSAAVHGLFTSLFFLFALFEILTLCVYALFWQQNLRRFTLVKAYSNKGIVVVWNLLWSAFLFGEKITAGNIVGAIVVIVGICLVSTDES
jgi:drug/metabolite transporter (DMT)-like permease